jgi:fatty acid desaturase
MSAVTVEAVPATPPAAPPKTGFYHRAASPLRNELAHLPKDALRALHHKSAVRHLLIAGRQFLFLLVAGVALSKITNPAIWIPLAVFQGLTIFNFTVLLHEVVHNAVFRGRNDRWTRLLGIAYAFPSGISALQFTRWHLDHHAELGDDEADPKRHHLSPKRNERWYKLLYFTPALFVIYFRAARKETATYPAELRKRIARERNLTMLGHVAILALLWSTLGFAAAARIQIVPQFLVFPVCFALNRLGQHYDIDRSDPAKWSTLMPSHWFWNFAYLNSNFHLEHHYFPNVPFYNLPALQKELRPVYEKHGMKPNGYGRLLFHWLVRNRKPHTDWSA